MEVRAEDTVGSANEYSAPVYIPDNVMQSDVRQLIRSTCKAMMATIANFMHNVIANNRLLQLTELLRVIAEVDLTQQEAKQVQIEEE